MQPIKLKELLKQIERDAIVKALEATGGNATHAADLLGLKRTTLHMLRRKYGLPIGKPGLREKETDEPRTEGE